MNRKGQVTVGIVLMLAVGIIVALTIFTGGISSPVSTMTNTISVVNETVTAPASGSTSTILRGQAVSNVAVINASSGTVVPASNYTITNYVVSNGQLVSTFTSNAGAIGFQGKSINVTYTYEPYGYDTNAGNRAVINLILIFAALAIAVTVIVPVVRGLDFF